MSSQLVYIDVLSTMLSPSGYPGDVTHPKLAQLDELHIHLVMPKVVKESYDDLIQGETMTFSRFIEEIQGLQADRPQSLTLL